MAAYPVDISKEGDRLYRLYLQSNASEVEGILEKLIRLADQPQVKPEMQAEWLFFAHSRIYVFEKKSGDSLLAESAFVKTCYWYLRSHELGGQSRRESAEALASFTADKCVEFVLKWDRDHNGGREARYAANGRTQE